MMYSGITVGLYDEHKQPKYIVHIPIDSGIGDEDSLQFLNQVDDIAEDALLHHFNITGGKSFWNGLKKKDRKTVKVPEITLKHGELDEIIEKYEQFLQKCFFSFLSQIFITGFAIYLVYYSVSMLVT